MIKAFNMSAHACHICATHLYGNGAFFSSPSPSAEHIIIDPCPITITCLNRIPTSTSPTTSPPSQQWQAGQAKRTICTLRVHNTATLFPKHLILTSRGRCHKIHPQLSAAKPRPKQQKLSRNCFLLASSPVSSLGNQRENRRFLTTSCTIESTNLR